MQNGIEQEMANPSFFVDFVDFVAQFNILGASAFFARLQCNETPNAVNLNKINVHFCCSASIFEQVNINRETWNIVMHILTNFSNQKKVVTSNCFTCGFLCLLLYFFCSHAAGKNYVRIPIKRQPIKLNSVHCSELIHCLSSSGFFFMYDWNWTTLVNIFVSMICNDWSMSNKQCFGFCCWCCSCFSKSVTKLSAKYGSLACKSWQKPSNLQDMKTRTTSTDSHQFLARVQI